VNEYIRTGGVQGSRDLRADAARAPGNEHHLVLERRILDTGCHGDTTIRQAPWNVNSRRMMRQQLTWRVCAPASRREIAAGGGYLSFEKFMDFALYAPGLGYYSGGAQKLGRDGDFTTAPEVSALFGACVAVQCAEVLGGIEAPVLMEIGAGTGRLALDVLTRLESLGRLPDRYWILDNSADLRDRQRCLFERRAPHLLERSAVARRSSRARLRGRDHRQ
jgi:hypothetical protein